MKTLGVLFFSSILFFNSISFAFIFGRDDRKEIYTDSYLNKNIGPAVGIMTSPVFLTEIQNGFQMDFDSISSSSNVGLCEGELFSHQPTTTVNCSGFLVAPDLLLTAGHCMNHLEMDMVNGMTNYCSDFVWVFDYKYESKSLIKTAFPKENVAQCKKILYAKLKYTAPTDHSAAVFGDDIALIQLDRKLNRPYLKLSTSENFKVGQRVYTVGYPTGLPLKITPNGKIKDNTFENFFTSSLDILGGNSGGPVLNESHEVIGVVARAFPDIDYVYSEKKECSVPASCSEDLKNCAHLTDEHEIEYSHIQKVPKNVIDFIYKSQDLIL